MYLGRPSSGITAASRAKFILGVWASAQTEPSALTRNRVAGNPQARWLLLLGGLLEQTVRERVAHQLRPAGKSQLLHHVRAVRLRRPDGDEELLRDLLVRVAEREQPQHLVLTVGERVLLGLARRIRVRRDQACAELGWT